MNQTRPKAIARIFSDGAQHDGDGPSTILYPSDEVRGQALDTISIETPRVWRIAKEKTTKKMDVIVALAMSCVSAMTIGRREPVRVL